MSTISDMFDDVKDFEQLMADAASQAKTEWAQEFVADIYDRYEKYGPGMFLSQKQREKLESIVDG